MTDTNRRPPVPTRDAVEAALVEIAEAEPAMAAAYLFGSLARGETGALSDVDVGLLVRDRRDDQAVCERTMDALCRRLHTSRIDVASLGSTLIATSRFKRVSRAL